MKSFKSFISLCEQSAVTSHGEPSAKYYRIMQKPHEILPVDSNQGLISAPPSSFSDETRAELMELQDRLELGKDNKEMLTKWDLDLLAPFVKYLKENNLRYDKELLDNIINDSTVVLLKQKYLFDRPRPGVVAKDMGLPLSPLKSGTADSPAYPSGHSGQSRLIALYLSGVYRDHSTSFLDLAEECGQSRLNAGVHYPSDHEAGVELGNKLYASMKTDETKKIKYKDLPAPPTGMEGY